jgi:GT2 family glycosyltransferase
VRIAVVVPVWNGRRWLEGLLASLEAQQRPADEIIAVDNGSTDGSVPWLQSHGGVRVIALGANTGFAAASNRGIEAAVGCDAVATINTDIELEPDWLARMEARLAAEPRSAAVACKMVDLADPKLIYDAGDILRRDGVCEQRGRFRGDDGRWDEPGEVFAACAGAALYRRDAVLALGGFDERFFAYLEDVDLGLRLRLAGWACAYEPAVARHAGSGSSGQLRRPVATLVARNTLLLVARAFPWRWAPLVAYRQLAWAWHAARNRGLIAYLRGAAAGLALAPSMWRERAALRAQPVSVHDAVPQRPWRGSRAGGHPKGVE